MPFWELCELCDNRMLIIFSRVLSTPFYSRYQVKIRSHGSNVTVLLGPLNRRTVFCFFSGVDQKCVPIYQLLHLCSLYHMRPRAQVQSHDMQPGEVHSERHKQILPTHENAPQDHIQLHSELVETRGWIRPSTVPGADRSALEHFMCFSFFCAHAWVWHRRGRLHRCGTRCRTYMMNKKKSAKLRLSFALQGKRGEHAQVDWSNAGRMM